MSSSNGPTSAGHKTEEINLTINDDSQTEKTTASEKKVAEAYNNPVFVPDHPSDIDHAHDHLPDNQVIRRSGEGPSQSISEESNTSNSSHQEKENMVSRALTGIETVVGALYLSHRTEIKWTISIFLFLAYNVYLSYAVYLKWASTYSWCDGVRFLVAVTAFAYAIVLYYVLLKKWVLLPGTKKLKLLEDYYNPILNHPWMFRISWSLVGLAVLVFLLVDSHKKYYRLVSAGGLVFLIAFGYLFSAHPRKIVWRHVFWGLLLQFLMGLLVLRWPVGRDFFECLGEKTETFLGFTDNGSAFVFGYLVTGKLKDLPDQLPIFAFKVLSVVIFFSFIVSILYFYGIMQVLVLKVGWFLHATLGTTACESMNAAGNIFLGMTEAPLMIKPYLPILTKSELHAVMTGGFATISGSVLAAYINFGVSPSHLLSASVMSAPAALAYAKLFYPETEVSKTNPKDIVIGKSTERNAIEAAANGASSAVALVSNIAANLIAFLACIHFLNANLSWFGSLVGGEYITFEWLLAQVFRPLAFVMGVRWDECENVGKLIGLKTIVNEFVAYQELGVMQRQNILSPRAEAISVFALCGFSNIGSIGISLGALTTMAPERKSDLAAVALRAMIAGSIACFTTACVAGALLDETTSPVVSA